MTSTPLSNFGALCDATLVSFAWESEGRDVAIQLILGNGTLRRYTFTWVDHLRIDIKQPDNCSSQPLSWEGTAVQQPSGRVQVLLDFAGQGAVSIECDEILTDGT